MFIVYTMLPGGFKVDASLFTGYQFLLVVTTIFSFFVTFVAFRLFNLMREKVPESAEHWRFMILGAFTFTFYQLFYVFHWANFVNVNDFVILVKLLKLGSISLIAFSLYRFTHSTT